MRASEIRKLSDMELINREHDLSEELFNLKFQLATGQLENNMRIPQVRKDIARIKTILKEGELKKEKEGGEKKS